jgi:hypothetical protein
MTKEAKIASETPLPITLGVPFQISPELNGELRKLEDSVLVWTQPIQVEGVGNGSVDITKNTDIENIRLWQPAYTPLGPVVVTHRIDNGVPEPELDKWPIGIEMHFENLGPEVINRVFCVIEISERVYVGTGCYDQDELEDAGQASLSIYDFYEWFPEIEYVEEDELGPVYYPHDASIFKDIKLTIALG